MAPARPPDEARNHERASSATPTKRKSTASKASTPISTPTATPGRPKNVKNLNENTKNPNPILVYIAGTGQRTSARKPSAAKSSIASCPTRLGPRKKTQESNLRDNFLVGKPTPIRLRNGALQNKSKLQVIKTDIQAQVLVEVRAPAKVQDKVDQWHKANATAEAPEVAVDVEDIMVQAKTSDGKTLREENKRIKSRASRRDGKRKNRSQGRSPTTSKLNDHEPSVDLPQSQSAAPRKRIVADLAWIKGKNATAALKGNNIDKNFLKTTGLNPLMEKKMQDWFQRTQHKEPAARKESIRRRNSMKLDTVDSVETFEDRERSRFQLVNDELRKKSPSGKRNAAATDDASSRPTNFRPRQREREVASKERYPGYRIKTSTARYHATSDGILIYPEPEAILGEPETEPARKNGKRRSMREAESRTPTAKKRSGKFLHSLCNAQSRGANSPITTREDDPRHISEPSSRTADTARGKPPRLAVSSESLDGICSGKSRFNLLDLLVGAEANTTQRAPVRHSQTGFGVPKVLKVYDDIIHDLAEFSRGGLNQPASIESWLNKSSDPITDEAIPLASGFDASISYRKGESHCEDYQNECSIRREVEKDDIKSCDLKISGRKKTATDAITVTNIRAALAGTEETPSTRSSRSLKRSPAECIASSTKVGRKLPLKEPIFSAINGVSTTKKVAPSLDGLIDLSEQDTSYSPSGAASHCSELQIDEPPFKRSPRVLEKLASQPAEDACVSPRSSVIWPARRGSGNRVPSIPSIKSYSTSSSMSDTASEYSQATVTYGTVCKALTTSSLSRKHLISSTDAGLKPRLTKHKYLMSILSLPDTSVLGLAGSIRSAPSSPAKVRHLETTTADTDLMQLEEDEIQYLRELNTLVDGVVPTLLISVLSKSDLAINAGFFDPLAKSTGETTFTQSITDMGIALEELRSQHQMISFTDAHALLLWADTARHTYEKYIRAWRSGFEDLVVNLASTSTTSPMGVMNCDKNGDLIDEYGEKVIVGDLLKKPLIRIKYINRALKCLADKVVDEGEARRISDDFNAVAVLNKKRNREESARKEDRAAWMVCTARARSLASLDLASDFEINRIYQVVAKDFFSMELSHSSGQRVSCGVELVLRKLPGRKNEGDLLVFNIDSTERFLLFEPIPRQSLSARLGIPANQIVLMAQGLPCSEFLILDANDNEIAIEWIKMFGTSPIPPPVIQNSMKIDPILESVMATPDADIVSVIEALREKGTSQVPIGERDWLEADELSDSLAAVTAIQTMRLSVPRPTPMTTLSEELSQDEANRISENHFVDVNLASDLLSKKIFSAMALSTPGSSHYKSSSDFLISGALNPDPEGSIHARGQAQSVEFLDQRLAPSENDQERIYKNGENNRFFQKSASNFSKPSSDDSTPPLPIHKTPFSESLETVLVLKSPNPKAQHTRTFSALKDESQASTASGTSSSEKMSESDDYSSSTSSSSFDDGESYPAEAVDTETLSKILSIKRLFPNLSLCSFPRKVLATPNRLASQALPKSKEVRTNAAKFMTMISQWNGVKGRWIDLHQDLVLIRVTDGLIESFDFDTSTLLSKRYSTADESSVCSTVFFDDDYADIGQTIIKQSLTPVVQVRQSTAIDVEIKSDIFSTQNSGISKATLQISNTVRYRTLNSNDCAALYSAINYSRLRNEVYLRLEEKARIRQFGSHFYGQTVAARNYRCSVFGLKRNKSYRASTHAVGEMPRNHPLPKSSSSTISVLRRLSGGGIFSIPQSFVENSKSGGRCDSRKRPLSSIKSMHTSSSNSDGISPPRVPNSYAGNSESIYTASATAHNLGNRNIAFRLYCRMKPGNWDDYGHAYLTVSAPPPDMKQRAPMDHGPRRRITITKSRIPNGEDIAGADLIAADLILDEVLGAELFKGLYRNGIVFQTWQDVDDGQQGGVRSFGGVGTTRHMWCLQFRRAGDQQFCLQLCRSGGF